MDKVTYLKANLDEDLQLLKDFIKRAGDSLATFRYFSKRPVSVIQQHLCTILISNDNIPVAYGHLDVESDKVWLGIAVTASHKGKGYGAKMMGLLLEKAQENNCREIFLSVDKKNIPAINLYQRFNFVVRKDFNEDVFIMSLLCNGQNGNE